MVKAIDFSVFEVEGTVCHHPKHKLGLCTEEGTIVTHPKLVEGLIREGYQPGNKVTYTMNYSIKPRE